MYKLQHRDNIITIVCIQIWIHNLDLYQMSSVIMLLYLCMLVVIYTTSITFNQVSTGLGFKISPVQIKNRNKHDQD